MAVRPALAPLAGAAEGSVALAHQHERCAPSTRFRRSSLTPRASTRSIRQLERDNAKLLQRLTLLLHQGGWCDAVAPTAADARKWRHKYMVELLRRASLERRNMQLTRQASRLSLQSAGAAPPLLGEAWEDPGELHELRLTHRPRLAHLDLA